MRAMMLRTCVAAAFVIVVSCRTSFAAADAPDENAEKRIAELETQVAELEESIEALGAVVEGTAHPINLGRTSLARVRASSVNGGRSPTDPSYGVLNAFDDGSNWISTTNYTDWLSGAEAQPYIEVVFDHAVSVTSIVVEGAPPFTTRFGFARGGEQVEPASTDRLELDAIVHGVSKVRLTFEQPRGNARVSEVHIMGYVPPNVEYTEGPPRLLITEREATVIATEACRTWTHVFQPSFGNPRVGVRDGATVFTFHRSGIDFVRVTVDMSSGKFGVEPLVRIVESSPDAAAEATEDSDNAASEEPLIHRVFPPTHRREFPRIR